MKKYFSSHLYFINWFIAIILASITIELLKLIGVRGALISMGSAFGFIYLANITTKAILARQK